MSQQGSTVFTSSRVRRLEQEWLEQQGEESYSFYGADGRVVQVPWHTAAAAFFALMGGRRPSIPPLIREVLATADDFLAECDVERTLMLDARDAFISPKEET